MEMIKLSNTTPKDEVNITKLYGLEATLKKEEFIQKYHVKED